MRWRVVPSSLFCACGVLAVSGCLRALAPALRGGRDHHRGITERATAEHCLACHEPEQAALQRWQGTSAADRRVMVEVMEAPGRPALVAQWMIDDRRPCLGCHRGPRGP